MTTKTKKPTSNVHKPAEQIMQTSLQLLPLIMNNIPQAVFWKDRDLVYLGCNQAFADDTGFSSPEDVIGKTDFDMPWKDQAELYRADDERILENGEPKLDYEEPQTTPDGSTIWLSTSKIPVNENGQVVAVLGMYEDITARKQAEKALIESEEKFRAIADNTAIGLFIHQGGIMRYLGREAGRLLGYEVEDVIGRSIMDFIHPDERQRIADMARRRTAGENVPDHYETRLLRKDGSALDVILYSTLVNYDGKVATQGAFLDITERKQTEQALQDSDAVYSAVVNQAYDGVIIVQDNTCQFANQVLANMLGYTPEEMQGTPFIKFLAPESIPLVVGRVKARLAGEEVPSIYEIRIQRKDGTAIDAELSAGVIEYHGKSADVAVIRDITERKQADNAIRESEDRFRRFTEATVEGLVFHEQGQIVDANPAAIAMFGFSEAAELIGKNLLEFITPESHELVLKQMQLESVQPYEIQGIRKDGSTFPVETSTRIYKSGDRTIRASSIRDITDRKRAEQALQDSEARYSAVVNQASDGVIILQNNACQFVNQVLADMLGYTPEEMQGTPFINYLAPESRALVAGRVKARLAGEEVPPVYEARLQRKDGTAFDAELSAGVIQYRGETADVGLIRDITERKQLAQQKQTMYERRGRQVQLSTQVSQSIAAATSLEELYQRVVTQVKEQFGYYHAQILRYDVAQNAVVLITGYGDIGAKMLAAGHRLPMGEGLIGTAAVNGETVLRPALENDPDWHPNPLLPETKGEIAVPIKLGDNILGVLDIQSNVAGALDADDQLLLEGMCGQIATAIESTRLRQEMSERLDEVNHLYQSMSREGWKTYRDTADLPAGFMFDPTGIKPVDETVLAD
ncbi:MAG TPA: PAS domain S-box protein, partial [Anaerolineales bacterium]